MKIKKKLTAILMTTILVGSNLLSLGNQVIAVADELEKQNSKTNHSNVEFNSYFEGSVHEKSFSIKDGGKMYIELNIKENGYLKNGIVEFSNENYQLNSDQIKSDYIQKIENEAIHLKQIYSDQNVLIEVPFYLQKQNSVDKTIFNQASEVIFKGTYIDGNGKERTIEKTVSNRVKWEAEPEINLNGEITKYLPYKVGEEYGVLIQAKINSGIKENILPIAKTSLEITVPTVNGLNPTRVTVVANNTKATNGLENGTNFVKDNYYYDAENGKITIQANNEENSQGKIAWGQENDEYLVTYIYTGEEVYNFVKEQLAKAEQTKLTEEEKQEGKENENAIQGDLTVKANLNVYQAEEKTIEVQGTLPYTIEEEKGELTDFNLTSVDNISKGYLYANYAKAEKEKAGQTIEEKKETTYELTYSAQIYDTTLNQGVTFDVNEEKLVADKQYTIEKNIITKQVKISEAIFQKMLGQEGKIEVTTKEGTLLGTIDTTATKDANANYTLDISDARINEISIKTSTPITEGRIELNVEKAFVTEQSYKEEQMKAFEKLVVEVTGKTNVDTKTLSKEIKLKEPVSKAQISIEEGEETLSTITVNKDVDITVVLDTSNIENALYKNPKIEIQMPSQVKKVEIKDINLLLDDELKIKEAKVVNQNGKQVILIILEGTQTKYQNQDVTNQEQNNVISTGTNIIVKTDITLDPLTPSKSEEIHMYYSNENTDLYEKDYQVQTNSEASEAGSMNTRTSTVTVGTASASVSLVAPTGVVAAHGISDYAVNKGELLSPNGENKEDKIEIYAEKRNVKIQGTITNNQTNSVENVFILGRTPFKGNKKIDKNEELGSSFTMPMTQKITTTGIDSSKIKIYYSTNGEATKDLLNSTNGWTEDPTDLSQIKSYLMVVSGELVASTQFSFSYQVELPENLSYNNSSYTNYKVYFDNKTTEATIEGKTTVAAVIGLTTGEGPELEVNLTSNMEYGTQQVIEGNTVVEKEYNYINNKSIARIFVTLKNIGNVEAKGVKIQTNLPEFIQLLSYEEYTGFYETIENSILVGDIKVGETKTAEYIIKVNCRDPKQFNVSQEISSNITAENMEKPMTTNKLQYVIAPTALESFTNETQTLENELYSATNTIHYEIRIRPSRELSNFKLTIPLPNDVTIKEAYWQEGESKNEVGITKENTQVVATLDKFAIGERVFILEFQIGKNTQSEFSTKVYAEADGMDKQVSDERFIHVGYASFKGEQLQPNKTYVKEQEEFQYQFIINTLENGTHNNLVFEDQLANELTLIHTRVVIENPDYGSVYNDTDIREYKDNKIKITIPVLPANSKVTITLKVSATLASEAEDGKAIINKATIQSNQVELTELNSVTNYIEYDSKIHIDQNTGSGDDNTSQAARYKITGKAWLDSNQDGKRDEDEAYLSGIKVLLIYKNNSQVVKDIDNGLQKIVTTDSNGNYEFKNLIANEYLVIFLYDSGKYSITQYQKEAIGESFNSDAIDMKIVLDGENQSAGVTDTIKLLDGNARDIDIGLFVAEKFDMRLEKYISKITLTTPTIGTKAYEYSNSHLEKVEILSRNVNKSNIIVEYNLVVTNEGQIPGYVKKIADYLPLNAKFSSELNSDWYLSDKGDVVYNTSLENVKIQPGESKQVKLILSLQITDKNIGSTVNNQAEIYEAYNEQGMKDIDSTEGNKETIEDDISEANIVLSIVTGTIILYTSIGCAAILILIIGIYQIKKRVLNKKN